MQKTARQLFTLAEAIRPSKHAHTCLLAFDAAVDIFSHVIMPSDNITENNTTQYALNIQSETCSMHACMVIGYLVFCPWIAAYASQHLPNLSCPTSVRIAVADRSAHNCFSHTRVLDTRGTHQCLLNSSPAPGAFFSLWLRHPCQPL